MLLGLDLLAALVEATEQLDGAEDSALRPMPQVRSAYLLVWHFLRVFFSTDTPRTCSDLRHRTPRTRTPQTCSDVQNTAHPTHVGDVRT